MTQQWAFWVDRGGTFTDVVARDPEGKLQTHKLLSEDPEHYDDAALEAIRRLTGSREIPAQLIESVKMGTTVATNALLERKGEPTVLLTTKGFADVPLIGYQNRPSIFDLHIKKPSVLFEKVIEVDARVSASGEVLKPLVLQDVEAALKAVYAQGYRSVAVLFMHGYRFPDHEVQIGALAKQLGFPQVSLSHEVSALIKLVGRGDTTVVDAYLSPILLRYINRVRAALGDTRLMFMQSNGGLAEAQHFYGKDAVLSGPAGGIVGAVATCERAGFEKLITFDMGGTSTDVAHYAGTPERTFDREVAGTRIRAPMMQIHTVAAGGGSMLSFDGFRFQVGPDSAGANPGPACYGKGGPLTVTDCNLFLGRLVPECFPKVFGPEGNAPLNRVIVTEQLQQLAQTASSSSQQFSAEDVAQGCLDIAVENMAQAIKKISVQRGYDVTTYTLCCFGGAGGQLACRVADALGMKRIFIHPYAGLLSAYGMGLADIRAMETVSVEALLSEQVLEELAPTIEALTQKTAEKVTAPDVDQILFEKKLHLKYQGTDKTLALTLSPSEEMQAAFEEIHQTRFGFLMEKPLVVDALTVEAIGQTGAAVDQLHWPVQARSEPLMKVRTDAAAETPVYVWNGQANLQEHEGPAIVINDHSTIVVEPGWKAQLGEQLILERSASRGKQEINSTEVDPVLLEIFNNLFMSIAEQMGYMLENTSASVNMKERLDFSCAIFDKAGNLIANAPHMPVHLGSMSESVKALLAEKEMAPGQVWAANNPYKGGTHLPDITVITPVFSKEDELIFYTASRGHHADIGGISPGSMPPFSKSITEEGVLLDNELLVEQGHFRDLDVRAIFDAGEYPSRNTSQNIADLKAQIAANAKGSQELLRMVATYGYEVVDAYMGHVREYAKNCVHEAIGKLEPGQFCYGLDQGGEVVVRIDIDKKQKKAKVDFTGTSAQQDSNFNAPAAVCKAAVLYAFRTLVDADIPLNAGCMEPLEIIIPEGCMLNPAYPAAVVAGNVETSQVITDAIYGALGALAASQGTMNNLTFGNERHQYYETICGGAGAGPGFPGADAVQTHMTNSRITDPEILELRYPVLLERFAIRKGSGGTGMYQGGDGVVRQIKFREAMTMGILANRRKIAPFGLNGGGQGKLGQTLLLRENGEKEVLASQDQRDVGPGDVVIIKTPGGGGYGKPE